jgi:hypothetical protein
MVNKQRQDHVFRLVQPHLKTKGLPIDDLDNVNCWENLHYALLCLDDEKFDMIMKYQYKDKNIETIDKLVKVEDMIVEDKRPEKGQTVDTGDKYLNEIEKALAKGDMQSVETLLRNM